MVSAGVAMRPNISELVSAGDSTVSNVVLFSDPRSPTKEELLALAALPPPPPPPPPPPTAPTHLLSPKSTPKIKSSSPHKKSVRGDQTPGSTRSHHSTPDSGAPLLSPGKPNGVSGHFKYPKESSPQPSPTSQKVVSLSPITDKTEESSPSTKSAMSPAERRRLRSRSESHALPSVDPPTGKDHQGRVSLAPTPTLRSETQQKPHITSSVLTASSAVGPILNALDVTANIIARSPRKERISLLGDHPSSSEEADKAEEMDTAVAPLLQPPPKPVVHPKNEATSAANSANNTASNSSTHVGVGTNTKKKKGFFGKLFSRGGRNKNRGGSSVQSNVPGTDAPSVELSNGGDHSFATPSDLPSIIKSLQTDELTGTTEPRAKEGDRPLVSTKPEGIRSGPLVMNVPAGRTEEEVNAFGVFGEDHGFHPSPSHQASNRNRSEISFAHDDVSTLSNPTLDTDPRRKSRDPTVTTPSKMEHPTSEPLGHYFKFDLEEEPADIERRPSIDPFEEPFFKPAEPSPQVNGVKQAEPSPVLNNGAIISDDLTTGSTKTGKGSQLSKLRVNTLPATPSHPLNSVDGPLGTSATQSGGKKKFLDPTPRGYETPNAQAYPDPIGESPLHKLERGPAGMVAGHANGAPDPPLYLTSIQDSSSSDDENVEEKKFEEFDDMGVDFPADLSILPSSSQLTASGHVGAIHPLSISAPSPHPSNLDGFASPFAARSPAIRYNLPRPQVPRSHTSAVSKTEPTPPAKNKLEANSNTIEYTSRSLPEVHDARSYPREDTTIRPTSRLKQRQEESPYRKSGGVAKTDKTEESPKSERTKKVRQNSTGSPSAYRKNDGASKEGTPKPPTPKYFPGAGVALRVATGEIGLARNSSMQKSSTRSPAASSVSSGELSIYDSDTGEKVKERFSPLMNNASRLRNWPFKNRVITKESSLEVLQQSPPPELVTSKRLEISSVARMSAKTVAYLHTLNGQPSPRNAWLKPTISVDEDTTPQSQVLIKASEAEVDTPGNEDKPFFRAYSEKFRGRKLVEKAPTPRSRVMANRLRRWRSKTTSPSVWARAPMNRDISINREVVSMGFAAFRYRRELAIRSGKSNRVVPTKDKKAPQRPAQVEPEPTDPIQRAGRRLLARAAVPIQACARRYLAQRAAVDRMWALIEIQSYIRRWRAEASLTACSLAASTAQRIIRGFLARKQFWESKAAATEIQRIVRGHLASLWAFDTVYSVIKIQSLARRLLVLTSLSKKSSAAVLWQIAYRRYVKRVAWLKIRNACIRIQTTFRGYMARTGFKLVVVDIILAQSQARCWIARQRAAHIRSQKLNRAAKTIQAAWRGFQGYTDYIFSLVDILLAQRVARRWLAKKEANRRRRNIAATKIQSSWRSYSARSLFILDLASIIRVQSVARVFLTKSIMNQRYIELSEENIAATKIQASWRSFWKYSHFVIMQFEVRKLQALVRGLIARKQQQFRLGCCILIQAAMRRFLARRTFENQVMERVFIASKGVEMRERLSAERIQFWWSVVLECRKEKAAALVIERFFIMVKQEVEKEIRRQEERSREKREKRRLKKKKSKEDGALEKGWSKTFDDSQIDLMYSASQSPSAVPPAFAAGSQKSSPSKSIWTSTNESEINPKARNHSASPSMKVGNPAGVVITDTRNVPASKRPKPITTVTQPVSSGQPSSNSLVPVDSLAFSISEYEHGSSSFSSPVTEVGLSNPLFQSRPNSKSSENINKYMNMYGIKPGSSRDTSNSKSSQFFTDGETPHAPTNKKISAVSSRSATPPAQSTMKGLSITDSDADYPKSLVAAAKASISKPKQTSPSSRQGKMIVMDKFKREKPKLAASDVSGSDESSFLAGEEFGLI